MRWEEKPENAKIEFSQAPSPFKQVRNNHHSFDFIQDYPKKILIIYINLNFFDECKVDNQPTYMKVSLIFKIVQH